MTTPSLRNAIAEGCSSRPVDRSRLSVRAGSGRARPVPPGSPETCRGAARLLYARDLIVVSMGIDEVIQVLIIEHRTAGMRPIPFSQHVYGAARALRSGV